MRSPSMFARLADILAGTARRPELSSKLRERRCLAAWPRVVGDRIVAVTKPLKAKDGVLTIAVKDSIWRNELGLMKSQIIEKLNKELGEPTITALRFSMAWGQKEHRARSTEHGAQATEHGAQSTEHRARSTSHGTPTSEMPSVGSGFGEKARSRIDEEEGARIRKALAKIDDERVADSLLSAWFSKRELDHSRKEAGWLICPVCGALCKPENEICPACQVAQG
jgi:rubrerythrin